jgi:hypothetical protein
MRDLRQLSAALLLAAPRAGAAAELRRRCAEEPLATARELAASRLASYALARLPELGIDPVPERERLEQAALGELGWTAKRRLALAELDAQAADGRPRLLFKGAATSLLFYPNETWRWSGDIDVMLHEADLAELHPAEWAELRGRQEEIPFPEHHLERQILAGTAVELHYRLEFAPTWGTLADLLPGARPCPGFPRLLVPAPAVSFTLALLHLLKHRGTMPFDFLDLARIEAAGLDWDGLAAAWRRAGILPYTVAALAIAHDWAGIGPPDTAAILQAGLRWRESREARFLRDCVLAEHLPRIRRYRFECLLLGMPFGRFCLRHFLGTRAATRRLAGHPPADPRFWLAHCLTLPARRLWRLLRGEG